MWFNLTMQCVHTHAHIYIHIHIYIYTYIYIHIYTYTYMHAWWTQYIVAFATLAKKLLDRNVPCILLNSLSFGIESNSLLYNWVTHYQWHSVAQIGSGKGDTCHHYCIMYIQMTLTITSKQQVLGKVMSSWFSTFDMLLSLSRYLINSKMIKCIHK